LIENLPQNIYAKDLDGRFIFANQHYCAIQNKRLDEIVGKTDYELHPRELAEKYRADDRQVLETGRVLEMEEEHAPIGGKKIFVQVIKTPFFDSKGQTAGTLGIFWDISDRKRAEIELRIARDQLEQAHRELQLSYAREHRLAHLDELTGINNRRSLVEYAEHEYSVAMRYGSPLSIMMVDIDDFKRINDSFGHSAGDQVLEGLARTVCAELRVTDIIGRYGGDEFVILLPQTGAHEALALAGRIQMHLAGAPLDTGQGLRITLSIGIAQTVHPNPHETLKKLFLRADQALYAAKQAGKNRIHIFDPDNTI
jgi:diguanylate cyclase (GGDEF)-like protein/PAS domain S-box-containing protein